MEVGTKGRRFTQGLMMNESDFLKAIAFTLTGAVHVVFFEPDGRRAFL